MRFFERILIFTEVLLLGAITARFGAFGVAALTRPWTIGLEVAVMVAALMFLAHVVMEDYRWQMAPAYGALLIAGALTASLLGSAAAPSPGWSVSLVLAGMGLALLSLALASILPVFVLPIPGGPHAIGTMTRRWSNPTRDGKSSPRLLSLQFWYPTEAEAGRLAPYRRSETWSPKSAQLAFVRTHAAVGTPLAGSTEGWPVVIFSPAWNGKASQNTIQFEMLASHGYVVAAIDHPAPASDIPVDFDLASEEKVRKYSVEVKRRADDVAFVLDRLAQLNDKDPEFAQRLDLSAIGIFGHSFGGAVAAEACWLDRRLRAGINMDGLMFGNSAEAGIEQPFFFMSDDTPAPSQAELQSSDKGKRMQAQAIAADMARIERSLKRYGGYYLSAEGLAHNNYSDRPIYSPLKRLTGAGSIEVRRAIQIVNDYTLAFFNWSLKGLRQPLLEISAEAPEIRFRQHMTRAIEECELV